MWCCASKPEVKKPLRSVKQQPFQKVTLNLPPTIRLEYKKKWQGKIESTNNEQNIEEKKISKKVQNTQNIRDLKYKIQQLNQKKLEMQQALNNQKDKSKQLQTGLSKAQAISTVLEYMILKQSQHMDNIVLKIKS